MKAELLQTPRCEATGLPLLIYPSEPPNGALFVRTDFHHPRHPRTDPELVGPDGLPYRYSIGQDTQRWLHNNYHDIFGGPVLASERKQKLGEIVLPCAGVAPRQALDVSRRGTFRVVNLTDTEFEWLTDPVRYHIEDAFDEKRGHYVRRAIGKFIASIALDQDVSQSISEVVIEQFLDPGISDERRKTLGNLIMTEALDMTVDDLRPKVTEFKKQGYVLPQRRRGLTEVVRKFVNKRCIPDYHDEISRRIQLAFS